MHRFKKAHFVLLHLFVSLAFNLDVAYAFCLPEWYDSLPWWAKVVEGFVGTLIMLLSFISFLVCFGIAPFKSTIRHRLLKWGVVFLLLAISMFLARALIGCV